MLSSASLAEFDHLIADHGRIGFNLTKAIDDARYEIEKSFNLAEIVGNKCTTAGDS